MKVAILESNSQQIENRATIATDLANIIQDKLGKNGGEEGFTQETGHAYSTEMLVKCVQLIENTRSAPLLLSGLYTVLRHVGSRSNKVLGAFLLGLYILKKEAYWIGFEKHRMDLNTDPVLHVLYEEIGKEIVGLHGSIIVLLGNMLIEFDKNIGGKSPKVFARSSLCVLTLIDL